MDWNEFAQVIAREVIAQLQKPEAGPCVMVLHPRDEALAARVQALLGEKTEIFFVGEERGRVPFRRILPYLSCSDMAALAVGYAPSSGMERVLQLLLQGHKVEVLEFESHSHAQTAPGPLVSLYAAHEKTLAGFGLQAFSPAPPEEFRVWDKLVTAKTVADVKTHGSSVLAVPSGAIVTPLAAEAAREAHVTILKKL